MIKVIIIAICTVLSFASYPQEAYAAKRKSFHAVKTWKQGYKENWVLDRVNQKHWRLDGLHLTRSGKGDGITIYVIDTGVGQDDCHGHGSVVASMAAGDQYGIAPNAEIVSAKALDCNGSGTAADVRNAVNWVMQNADPGSSIVNMSLGGSPNASVDAAVAELASLMPVVVAAGNEATDACNKSPARVPNAITVAGYDRNNFRSLFSNYGPCVDMWAPGSAVDGVDKDGQRVQWSGTSMSTALVSGAIAFIASRDGSDTNTAAITMMSEAARPYLIDARLSGVSAYSLLIKD